MSENLVFEHDTDYVSPAQAAKATGVSKSWVLFLLTHRAIPAIRGGEKQAYLIHEDDLIYIKQYKRKPRSKKSSPK